MIINQEIAKYEVRRKFNYQNYQHNLNMLNTNIFNQHLPNIFFPIVEQPTYNFIY